MLLLLCINADAVAVVDVYWCNVGVAPEASSGGGASSQPQANHFALSPPNVRMH